MTEERRHKSKSCNPSRKTMLSGLSPRAADRRIAIDWFGTTTPPEPITLGAITPFQSKKESSLALTGKMHFVADGSNTQRSVMRYDLNMRTWQASLDHDCIVDMTVRRRCAHNDRYLGCRHGSTTISL